MQPYLHVVPSAVASAASPVTLLAALPAGLEFLAQGVVPLLTGGLALLLLIVVVAQLLGLKNSIDHWRLGSGSDKVSEAMTAVELS